MHFEILVEDQSGKILLESIIKSIIGKENTYAIRSYKGVGRLPKNIKTPKSLKGRVLLNNLPRLIAGYGKSWHSYDAVLFIVVDLDDKNKETFLSDLQQLHKKINLRPDTTFSLAIEEMEAWLLGDETAVLQAYPQAKKVVLKSYQQDSICGTWELLADAIYEGGSPELKKQGYPTIGIEKCKWAKKISQSMNIDKNKSPSFQNFRDSLRQKI